MYCLFYSFSLYCYFRMQFSEFGVIVIKVVQVNMIVVEVVFQWGKISGFVVVVQQQIECVVQLQVVQCCFGVVDVGCF